MTNPIIQKNGNRQWYNEKRKLHRTDGPAVIRTNGGQEWYQNGKLHRIDGPAVIRADGTQFWYQHDTNITREVTEWLAKYNITWPFDNKQDYVMFLLRWG